MLERRGGTGTVAWALLATAGLAACVRAPLETPPGAAEMAEDAPAADSLSGESVPAEPPATHPESGVDPIPEWLRSADKHQRIRALNLLGARGDPQLFAVIVGTVERETDSDIRSAGMAALARLNYNEPFLLGVLEDPHQPLLARAFAAYTLGRMETAAAVPALISALESPEPELREHAIRALRRIRDMRAFKPLIVASHKDPLPSLRVLAEQAAQSLPGESETDIQAETLNVRLESPNTIERREAARKLARYGNWWSVPLLIETLNDSDEEVRRYSARALGDLKDERAATPLLEFITRSGGRTRHTAIIALAALGDPSVAQQLVPYLEDPDPETRRYTARALGLLGAEGTGPALRDALQDPIPHNRQEIARAIGRVHYAGAIPDLFEMSRKDVEENQFEAIRSMGLIGSPEAIPLLERTVKSPNTINVVVAVGALRTIGDPAALPILDRLVRDHEEKWVKEEALAASIELRGAIRLRELESPSASDGG